MKSEVYSVLPQICTNFSWKGHLDVPLLQKLLLGVKFLWFSAWPLYTGLKGNSVQYCSHIAVHKRDKNQVEKLKKNITEQLI